MHKKSLWAAFEWVGELGLRIIGANAMDYETRCRYPDSRAGVSNGCSVFLDMIEEAGRICGDGD
jgi:hypothetical protein